MATETKTKEKLNLYEKMQAISMEVNNISKNMTVGTGNYSYKAVSDLDVTLQVKKAEEKFKLYSVPISQEIISSEKIRIQKTTRQNNIETTTEQITYVDDVKMIVRFIDLEDTSSYIDIISFGKGIDNGDKGFGKASTYARKYALLNAYKIATGEDPDAKHSNEIAKESESTNPPQTQTQPQIKNVTEQMFNTVKWLLESNNEADNKKGLANYKALCQPPYVMKNEYKQELDILIKFNGDGK